VDKACYLKKTHIILVFITQNDYTVIVGETMLLSILQFI